MDGTLTPNQEAPRMRPVDEQTVAVIHILENLSVAELELLSRYTAQRGAHFFTVLEVVAHYRERDADGA